MRTHTNGSRKKTATAMLSVSAAALGLLAGCGDDGGPQNAVAPDTADATIGDLQQWCDVIADVDARFTTLDASEQSFAEKQRGYEEVGHLLAQVDASASEVVDAIRGRRRPAVARLRRPRSPRHSSPPRARRPPSWRCSRARTRRSRREPSRTGRAPPGYSTTAGSTSTATTTARRRRAAPVPVPVVAGDPIPVVVDYSPTSSDVTALLYLAEHPGVDLRAVTLAGTGESRCEAAIPNTVALLALAGHPDVPVACGRTQPIGAGNEWPPEWRDAADELAGLDTDGERRHRIRSGRHRPAGRHGRGRGWQGDRRGAGATHQHRRGRPTTSGPGGRRGDAVHDGRRDRCRRQCAQRHRRVELLRRSDRRRHRRRLGIAGHARTARRDQRRSGHRAVVHGARR